MKQITKFFDALANVADAVRVAEDLAWLDIFPATTTRLSERLDEFGLDDSSALTEQQKRARLDAAWKATGSLAPRYLQDTLQGLGFAVYVHEWWAPGTEPTVGVQSCAVPKNPFLYLLDAGPGTTSQVQCGEPEAQCGEPDALCGNTLYEKGYPLVNKVTRTVNQYVILCGESLAQCGEPEAQCGGTSGVIEVPVTYILPSDPNKWHYFVYVGAETFPDLVTLPAKRREEFEKTLLKYCPAHLWIGVLVNYV